MRKSNVTRTTSADTNDLGGHVPGYDGDVSDPEVVSWQLGRPVRAFRGVALRCPFGFPAVTEQAPLTSDGTPFPTSFYLTCPWLVTAVSRIEASGGVVAWTERAAADAELGESLAEAQREQRSLRPELDVGIAGAANDSKVKCMHAHVAFALAKPGYVLGERMLAEIDEPWCADARCAEAVEPSR